MTARGPRGMFAIEVKYVNGTFAVTRERWRYVRYDNYGNQVGEGLRGGRVGCPAWSGGGCCCFW